MKKNAFTTSYRILLPVILAIALLVPKKPGQIAILILFGLWVVFLLIHYLSTERCTNRKCGKSLHRKYSDSIPKQGERHDTLFGGCAGAYDTVQASDL